MDEKEMLNLIEILEHNNRELKDEAMRLRPLARLANVIAMMEAGNARLFTDLTQADRDLEDSETLRRQLRGELESGTQEKRPALRAAAWALAGASAAWLIRWRHKKAHVMTQYSPAGAGGTGHG